MCQRLQAGLNIGIACIVLDPEGKMGLLSQDLKAGLNVGIDCIYCTVLDPKGKMGVHVERAAQAESCLSLSF